MSEKPIKLYNTKGKAVTPLQDALASDKVVRNAFGDNPPAWGYETQVYQTCSRCQWRFVWKSERKYCSDECRYNRKEEA